MLNYENIRYTLFNKSIYIISTPIGNILDISIRSLYILKNVKLILSEDTRITNKLLNFYSIKNNIVSFNGFNENKKINKIINFLENNNNLALVSDSGTPLINDPGQLLIKEAINKKINIFSIPGACAAISCLSISGLKTNKFCYEGFIPKNKNKKINLFKLLKNEYRTIIFYESPIRLIDSLNYMKDIFGEDRYIVIIKDITKKWENIIRGSLYYSLEYIKNNKNFIKGEIVIIIKGNNLNKDIIDNKIIDNINILQKKFSFKDSIKILSKILYIKKNKIYSFLYKNNKKKI